MLNWNIQQCVVPFRKSVTPSRIVENINVFDFALTQDERSGEDPDNYKY